MQALIDTDSLIDDIMQAWPATLRPLLRRRMACIGCEAAAFHTVADIARIYRVSTEALLAELRLAAADVRDGATRFRPNGRAHAGRGPRLAGGARR